MRAALTFGLVLSLLSTAHADPRYTGDARVDYVDRTLQALRMRDGKTIAAIAADVHKGARTDCKAGASDPPVRCMLDVARKVCAARPEAERAHCALIADVVVTNLLAEKSVVPSQVRFKLMNDADGYRTAMNRHLMTRYAVLAARLTLTPGFDQDKGLARSVDGFCRKHILRRNTTWARCVSAIVWYIGTSHKGG